MKKFNLGALLATALLALTSLVGCESTYATVPPGNIGMVLTPTGFQDRIYSPGQVDIGIVNQDGSSNKLVLIENNGFEIKEQFLSAEGMPDKQDHRCMLGNKDLVSFDVRLLFALGDPNTEAGKKDIARVVALSDTKEVEGSNGRVLRISAESVYYKQVQPYVRNPLRLLCTSYKDYDDGFAAFSDTGDKGMNNTIKNMVASVITKESVPLRLVIAVPSNFARDPSATAAQQQAQNAKMEIDTNERLAKSLENDPTGARKLIYQMQSLQKIVTTGQANGHTVVVVPYGSNAGPIVVGGGGRARPEATAAKEAEKPAEKK